MKERLIMLSFQLVRSGRAPSVQFCLIWREKVFFYIFNRCTKNPVLKGQLKSSITFTFNCRFQESGLGSAFWEMFKDQIQIYTQRALRMLQYGIFSYNEWALLNHHQTGARRCDWIWLYCRP